MLRTHPRGALMGAALTTVLAVGLLPSTRRGRTGRRGRGARSDGRRRRAGRTGTRGLPVDARVEDLLGRMTLGREGRPDDPGRAGRRRLPTRALITDATASAPSCPAAARCRRTNTPGGLGRHGRRLPGRGARAPGSASRCSTASTRCTATATCSAPRSSRTTSARRHPRPEAGGEDRPHHRQGDPRDRSAVGVRAVRLRGPRRPLGPRPTSPSARTRRWPSSWRPSSTGSRAGPASSTGRPGAGHRQALRRRRARLRLRHRRGRLHARPGHRPGHRARDFDRLALAPYGPAIDRHDVGSVMPSFSSVDWTDDGLGNPVKMHATEELITDVLKGELGLRRASSSPTGGRIHQIPGDYRDADAAVGQRRHRHVHGAARPQRPGWHVFIPTLISAGRGRRGAR